MVFYRSTERGKCFIEYIPAENAWVPIQADGYVYIDCLWVSGSLKGHGYANELLQQCVQDAKGQGRKGLCILSAEGRKREFLSDPKFMAYKGFAVADTSECGINLMYLPFEQDAEPPKFKACAKHPAVEQNGFVLYYTDQCPFTYYWVPRVEEAAREHGIPLKAVHITSKVQAQNVPAPVYHLPCRPFDHVPRAIPHNSKCRYGERGAAAARPKAQIILDVLSSILATQMPCRSRRSGA